jgi:hypothetical protein
MNNGRDITMRKSIEWGDVKTDDKGNSTIRYQFLALIWDKERKILCLDFTFDKDGKYVSMQKVEGFPKDAVTEKPDTATPAGVKRLVEKFFSENFRDITARKTLKWGEPEYKDGGSVSITYRYEATIWDKDKIIQEQKFTFDKDGQYVGHETIEKLPVKDSTAEPDVQSLKKTADEYLKLLSSGQFAKAFKMGDKTLQLSLPAEKLEEIWADVTKKCGNFEKVFATHDRVVENNAVFDSDCHFGETIVTIRIAVAPNKKVIGLFITKIVPANSSAQVGSKEK